MSDYELHHGDMLEVMPTLVKGSVAFCFADIPYGVLSHRPWDVAIDLAKYWEQLTVLLSRNGVTSMTTNMRLAGRIIATNEKNYRYDLIWQKTYGSNFLLAKKRPLCVHEHILVFAKASHRYNPQMRDEKLRRKTWNKLSASKAVSDWHSKSFVTDTRVHGPMYPISVLRTYEKRTGKVHPTQKPVALLEWLIATYTNPGDTVLDPCFGSNSTGVACMRLGRRYIGIERDEDYFAAGKKRIEDECAKLATQPAQSPLAFYSTQTEKNVR